MANIEGKFKLFIFRLFATIAYMVLIWDYNIKKLKKTASGRRLILERMINYGPDKGEKIKLSEVKKNWEKLNIAPSRRRLLELLIWNK